MIDPLRVAADLMAAHGWDTPEGARGRCGDASYAFRKHFPMAGGVRVWTDYGMGPDAYGHRRAEHNAALLWGRVYDLTARQFEPGAGVVWYVGLWFHEAVEWVAGEHPVIAEMYTSADRLRRSWRVW